MPVKVSPFAPLLHILKYARIGEQNVIFLHFYYCTKGLWTLLAPLNFQISQTFLPTYLQILVIRIHSQKRLFNLSGKSKISNGTFKIWPCNHWYYPFKNGYFMRLNHQNCGEFNGASRNVNKLPIWGCLIWNLPP